MGSCQWLSLNLTDFVLDYVIYIASSPKQAWTDKIA